MTKNNAVNSPLSGTTGTGDFVGSISPTLVTPTLGAATATSISFSPTTGGQIGTTAADNASSGIVGEVISSNIASGSPVSCSTNTPRNLTSISLTAGDWDVYMNANAISSANVMSAIECGINTTSATFPDASNTFTIVHNTSAVTQLSGYVRSRINVSITTTVYGVVQVNFTSGTATASGNLFARRAR